MNQFTPHPRVFCLDRLKFFENSRRYSRVKVRHRYQRHRWQICHRYQRQWRQIFTPFSLALLIPVANLPPVSTIPASNLPPVANCHRYQRHQLEGFFHLPPVSLTPVANLELRISPRIFEKICNNPNGIIRGLGETDSRKKQEEKNLVTLSL